MTAEASWFPDPAGRHQLRYHDGTTFTSYVCDNGVVGVDGDAGAPVEPLSSYPPPTPFGAAPPPLNYRSPAPAVGPYWTGGPYAPAGPRHHGGLIALICVAVLEGIVILALAVALVHTNARTSAPARPIGSTVPSSGSFSQAMGSVVYSSKFADSEQWPSGQLNDNTTASLSGGRYAITAWTDVHHPLVTPYAVAHRGISVDASTAAFSGTNVSMGTGCQSAAGIDPALVYQLSVYPDGQWYIEEARLGGAVDVLDAGSTAALGTTASVQLTCVMTDRTSDTEVTQLVAYVDGNKVGAIGRATRGRAISGYLPILLVGSLGPTVHVTFTGIVVRDIDPSSVTSVQTL